MSHSTFTLLCVITNYAHNVWDMLEERLASAHC